MTSTASSGIVRRVISTVSRGIDTDFMIRATRTNAILSVCLFVTLVICVDTAKRIIGLLQGVAASFCFSRTKYDKFPTKTFANFYLNLTAVYL